jgi:hypothetical protein
MFSFKNKDSCKDSTLSHVKNYDIPLYYTSSRFGPTFGNDIVILVNHNEQGKYNFTRCKHVIKKR